MKNVSNKIVLNKIVLNQPARVAFFRWRPPGRDGAGRFPDGAQRARRRPATEELKPSWAERSGGRRVPGGASKTVGEAAHSPVRAKCTRTPRPRRRSNEAKKQHTPDPAVAQM